MSVINNGGTNDPSLLEDFFIVSKKKREKSGSGVPIYWKEKQINYITNNYDNNIFSVSELASKFQVSQTTIRNIINRYGTKHKKRPHAEFHYTIGQIVETKTGKIQVTGLSRQRTGKQKNIRKYIDYKCLLDGYSNKILEDSLNKGYGCLVCGGKTLVKGINDIATIFPQKIDWLLNPDDAFNYSYGSQKYADFRCQKCGEKITHKIIKNVISQDFCLCAKCKETAISKNEKIVWSLLRQLHVDFLHDSTTIWSHGKRYDFYIKSLSLIIETHGIQHYKDNCWNKSLEQIQYIDNQKEKMAKDNSIQHYVILDCRTGEFEDIKSEILNSELKNLFNLETINWNDILENFTTPISQECLKLWNDGIRKISEISALLNVGKSFVKNSLKIYSKLGECDYPSKTQRRKT